MFWQSIPRHQQKEERRNLKTQSLRSSRTRSEAIAKPDKPLLDQKITKIPTVKQHNPILHQYSFGHRIAHPFAPKLHPKTLHTYFKELRPKNNQSEAHSRVPAIIIGGSLDHAPSINQ
jgi:hypothetical protein